jgi:hypothetical protein
MAAESIDLVRALQAYPKEPTVARLPGASPVLVTTVQRLEKRWPIDETPALLRAVPGKPAFDFDGTPTWVEFIVLRLLERAGWEGVWVKNFNGGRAFWRDICQPVELPAIAAARFRQIEASAGRTSGCWDVFAWKGEEVLFAESKRLRSDKLNDNQLNWLAAALRVGVPLSSFAVVEWRD